MKIAILFDLDGTLWDSTATVALAWQDCLAREAGISGTITRELIRQNMGRSAEDFAESVLKGTDVSFSDMIPLCEKTEIEYIRKFGGELYDDLRSVLDTLHKEYFLAIISNCQTGYIEAFLSHHDLASCFDDFECNGKTGLEKKENIRIVMERNHIEHAVFVGDLRSDMLAAAGAGLPFIQAAYGFGPPIEGQPYIRSLTDLLSFPFDTL